MAGKRGDQQFFGPKQALLFPGDLPFCLSVEICPVW